ncbi:MAG: TldD/PmbA family protein [Pseudanabaenaceae cyanobacterium bins.68]|nr:TldD/PmbA family protein [Pseudanabaenaceae cyanobacterium bins.68]
MASIPSLHQLTVLIMAHLAENVLDLALRHGVEAVEVYALEQSDHTVSYEANQLKQIESSQVEGYGLRIWQNHRPGIAVAFGKFDPQELIDRALALSALNPPEEICWHTGIRNVDHSSPPPETAELVAGAESAIARIREFQSEILCHSDWQWNNHGFRLINSQGLDCTYRESNLSGSLSAEWVRGEDFLQVWAEIEGSDRLQPQDLTQQILARLNWAINSTPAPPGQVPVLFTPKAAEVLLGTVVAAISARQLEQKTTPWTDRLGSQVLDPQITLSQDPSLAPYHLPFDHEGSVTQKFNWIEQGRLQGFYSDLRRAKALGIPSLGNGFRSDLGSKPQPGLFNLVVAPGALSFEQMLDIMTDGMIVDQILGDGGGITGDFSFNLDLGYRVQQGKIVGRVKDTMVSGNAYQALGKDVHLGQERQWQGSLYSPALLVDGLSVTASG